MPNGHLRLLRASITFEEAYQSPRGGGQRPQIPERYPAQHAQALLAQLDAVVQEVQQAHQQAPRDPEATRELIALRPETGYDLPEESLADKKRDVRLVSKDEDSGVVLIDAPSPDLPSLRAKIQRFADDTKLSKSGRRRSEDLVATLAGANLADLNDRTGPVFRAAALDPNAVRWFELACRGGVRSSEMENERSKAQLNRVFEQLHLPPRQEFAATERLLVFAHLSTVQLRGLIAATDCVYEFDLAGPDIRDWLLVNDVHFPVQQLQAFQLTAPSQEAPSVVLMDSGVVSQHPVLGNAILSQHSVVAGDPSPADIIGHGTGMAGVALHSDVGAVIQQNAATAEHWIQNVKLLRENNAGAAAEENRKFWPVMTENAIKVAEDNGDRRRVFCLAITAPLMAPHGATSWSHAVDQLAYNDGRGRLIVVSIGNTDPGDHMTLAQGYPTLNLDQKIEDPAHAANALTIGAYTEKLTLPPGTAGLTCVAPGGGVSLFTRAGLRGAQGGALKPDVAFEGGNAAFDQHMVYADLDTLSTITTGREFLVRPLVTLNMTSLAAANGARFAAQLWRDYPELQPQTIRGLIVHSAAWTPQMLGQFPQVDERMSLCGYGVPDLSFARECAQERATVVVEGTIPNCTIEQKPDGSTRKRRVAKLFRVPIPEDQLLDVDQVELRVTLSYFAEPNTFRRTVHHGMDLAFDVQGPTESEDAFRRRINKLLREGAAKDAVGAGSFDWRIKKSRRSRGTVQSDRWDGTGAFLAGPKLIAVYPVLGWWDPRRGLEEQETRFSLIVTVRASGIDLYTPISQALIPVIELPA